MKRQRYRHRPRLAAEVRFWRRVDIVGVDECWTWIGGRDRDGYGQFHVNASTEHDGRRICIRAQRFAWMLAHGTIPDEMHVLHHCDNPSCVNVKHLFLGTNADNVADREHKGRTARGEQSGRHTKPEKYRNNPPPPLMFGAANPATKLTTASVRAIREDCRAGYVIAKEHGVSKSLISAIKRMEIWREIGPATDALRTKIEVW